MSEVTWLVNDSQHSNLGCLTPELVLFTAEGTASQEDFADHTGLAYWLCGSGPVSSTVAMSEMLMSGGVFHSRRTKSDGLEVPFMLCLKPTPRFLQVSRELYSHYHSFGG